MNANTTQLAKRTFAEVLVERRKDFEGRLPQGMSVDRFMYGVRTAIQKVPKLEECDPRSLFLAAYEAAECGCDLSPSRAMGWIIPYGNQATFQPSYRHFIQMAYKSGIVKSFFAECVYANDKFRIAYAPQRTVVHEPHTDANGIPAPISERGERRGAYALIEFTDGHFDFIYCDEETIDKHRKHSKQPDSLMWTKFANEGACKTAIRLLFKRLPEKNEALIRVADIVARDEENTEERVTPGMVEFQAPPPAPEPEPATEITYKGLLLFRWGTGDDQDIAYVKADTVPTFKAMEKPMKKLGTFMPSAREWVVVKENVQDVYNLAAENQIECEEVK